MADEIRADYDQLDQIAARFRQRADATQEMIQTISSHVEQLEGGGWIGRGANAFFSEMRSVVMPGVVRLRDALTDASQGAQNISQIVQQAEEEASAPFRV